MLGRVVCLLVKSNIVILHHSPVSPLEGHPWRTAVYLDYFPSKCRHHSFERLVAAGKVRVFWTVVFVWGNDGIVSSHFKHILAGLRRSTIDGEAVVLMIDGTPIGEFCLE